MSRSIGVENARQPSHVALEHVRGNRVLSGVLIDRVEGENRHDVPFAPRRDSHGPPIRCPPCRRSAIVSYVPLNGRAF